MTSKSGVECKVKIRKLRPMKMEVRIGDTVFSTYAPIYLYIKIERSAWFVKQLLYFITVSGVCMYIHP